MRSHTGERPFKCTYDGCSTAFTREAHLTRHISLVHKKERPYKCPTCNADFSTKSNMERHHKKHTETKPKPFACTYEGCQERFAKKNQLERHSSVHTGLPPYQCNYEGCTEAFASSSARKKHYNKVHLGLKTHVCGHPNCGEAFETYILLRRHQRENHAEEYECEKCSRVFSTQESLDQHKKKHENPEENVFMCAECGKSYVKKTT